MLLLVFDLIVGCASPRARPPFLWGLPRFYVHVCCYIVSQLRSTRHGLKIQSHGDPKRCSILSRFPERERGRLAESPSMVLSRSSRMPKVGEDEARCVKRVDPTDPED